MKALLEFPQELVDQIAERVVAKIIPLLQLPEQEDSILSIEGVVLLIWGYDADIKKKKGQIYQWVDNAKYGKKPFPFMKSGRTLRFSKNAIIKWMKNNGKPLEGS